MMEKTRGPIVRGLVFCREAAADPEVSADDLALINRYALEPLTAADVYVRSMYLASNQICEQDWRAFTRASLDQIAALVRGQSVMVGHNRETLPVARFFSASVVERGELGQRGVVGISGENIVQLTEGPTAWVRAWFYWLRATQDAEDLKRKIDGGIYREGSISWISEVERCSICGHEAWDWENCQHWAGQMYDGQRCVYVVERVRDVLEGSIVFKGADKGTGFDREKITPLPSPPPQGGGRRSPHPNPLPGGEGMGIDPSVEELSAALARTELRCALGRFR